jgi:general secretion pathway protein G
MIKKSKGNAGFSLVELVIVVSVLAVLAAVATPQVTKLIEKSRVARLENELKGMKDALNTVYADIGVFPKNVNAAIDPSLSSVVGVPKAQQPNWQGPYMDRWPTTHPFGGTYDYQYGGYKNFNKDGTANNEVYVTVSGSLTTRILERLDKELDDGKKASGNLIYANTTKFDYYIGEGSSW